MDNSVKVKERIVSVRKKTSRKKYRLTFMVQKQQEGHYTNDSLLYFQKSSRHFTAIFLNELADCSKSKTAKV